MDGTLADKEGAAMEKAELMAVIDDQATKRKAWLWKHYIRPKNMCESEGGAGGEIVPEKKT